MRYYIQGSDGEVYGPADIATINEWIAQGRIVPTTLLQPENSQMRVAASTIPGLVFAPNQTFAAYTPQSVNEGKQELVASWVCLGASVGLCCFGAGFHITAGIFGMILGAMAYRKGHQIALLPLILNLLMMAVFVFGIFGALPGLNLDSLRERFNF